MLAERDAVKRESTVLLASAANDKRLADALMEIEKLNIVLEQERAEKSAQVVNLSVIPSILIVFHQ
jgi:hypothetical protein